MSPGERRVRALDDAALVFEIECWNVHSGVYYWAQDIPIPARDQRRYDRLLAEYTRRPWIAEAEARRERARETRLARQQARQQFLDAFLAGGSPRLPETP
jgi:hypothetical protein